MTYSQVLEIFISLSLQAALLVVVVNWLGRLAGSENARSQLWTGCFVSLLALFFGAVSAPHIRLIHPWTALGGEQAAEIALLEMQLGKFLFVIWGIGALLTLALFIIQFGCLARFLSTCRTIEQAPEAFSKSARDAVAQLPDGHRIVLLFGAGLSSPFCWQFRRPCLALPKSLVGLSPEEVRLIVRHEYEHLRCGHPLHLFLQRLVEIVFWFHPMVWWASYQASLSREFACDDATIDSPADVALYLRTLLKVVEQNSSQDSAVSLSLGFGRGGADVAQRARRLVQIAQRQECSGKNRLSQNALRLILVLAVLGNILVWLPVDVLASSRTSWSPWPSWTAGVLRDFGIQARDFEPYDTSTRLYEVRERVGKSDADITPR